MNKRRQGLLKKAYELSVLCDCEVSLVITPADGRIYEYGNTDVKGAMRRWLEKGAVPTEHHTNFTMQDKLAKKSARPSTCAYIPAPSPAPEYV